MSVARLCEQQRIWRQKRVLSAIYQVWFDFILERLPPGSRVLEVGAGPGFFAAYARKSRPDLRWLASDLLAVPWNDLAADALCLPFRTAALDAIVGVDFIHHLAQPADFFRESGRVLRAGGQIVVVEPWITPFSYPIYRFLHHEGCRLRLDPWAPFAEGRAKDAFNGESALVHQLVRRTDAARWLELGFQVPRILPVNAFAYLLALGFKPPSLLPRVLAGPLRRFDTFTRRLSPWLGLRAEITWRRAV
jgi:SAM-dependent methyltransferase